MVLEKQLFYEQILEAATEDVHRKTPVPELLSLIKLQASASHFIKKEALAQLCSCNFRNF